MESVEKRTKVLTSKEDFLSQVDPKTLGCIWVTDGPLESRERPFIWFDYLLDGILEKHILKAPKSPNSFFTANQFDRHFYVLQIERSFPNLDQAFEEAFMLMKQTEGQNKVLCLGQNSQVFSVPYIKKKKELTFTNLIY
jgi:hypothetical protein